MLSSLASRKGTAMAHWTKGKKGIGKSAERKATGPARRRLAKVALKAEEPERCSHLGCHVQAIKVTGCLDGAGFLRRGFTCGNHEADKPQKGN